MTVIGIDPSMNSTGICINKDGKYIYKLIATKPTKKMLKEVEGIDSVEIVTVHKLPNERGVVGEINKSKNINYILEYIRKLLDIYRPDYVVIEAPAFNAVGRVSDLSGLNHAIRLECIVRNIPVWPLSPTAVKMQTVGNGQATKEMMIQTWLKIFPEYTKLASMKVDDLADAWALCVFPVEIYHDAVYS